ncbi:hypothetical protein E4U34_005438 [Claviceps purpurea]|nr:hypothetical protein E4U34_005438 [Claviceps purpurea]
MPPKYMYTSFCWQHYRADELRDLGNVRLSDFRDAGRPLPIRGMGLERQPACLSVPAAVEERSRVPSSSTSGDGPDRRVALGVRIPGTDDVLFFARRTPLPDAAGYG